MAKRRTKPTGELTSSGPRLDDELDPSTEAPVVAGDRQAAPAAADQPRGRQSHQPTCPYHKEPCVARHTSTFFTYYYCKVEGCPYSEKQARPNMPTRRHQADQQGDHSAR